MNNKIQSHKFRAIMKVILAIYLLNLRTTVKLFQIIWQKKPSKIIKTWYKYINLGGNLKIQHADFHSQI